MTNMPPTSSVICGHIRRACYFVRKVVDHTANELDCCQFRWENAGIDLKPAKCMNPLPPDSDIMITNVQVNVKSGDTYAKKLE